MKKSLLRTAVASGLSLCLVVASVGMASAQGLPLKNKKVVVVKPNQKVVVVKPGPGPRGPSNRNRNVGLGLGVAAVVGTAIAIEAARANSGERRYYRGGGDGLSCP
ncbi:MAG: hypothetical protein ABL907_12500, partial [Hyphomicrobium sp.]